MIGGTSKEQNDICDKGWVATIAPGSCFRDDIYNFYVSYNETGVKEIS